MRDLITKAARRTRRLRRDPDVVLIARGTVASVISFVIALHLSSQPAPLTAPLTALLVVQVTLYSTLTMGIKRVNAVVVGVLLAIGFSAVVGLSWWSLGLIVLVALVIGRWARTGEFVNEVAISAMLVLGVTRLASQAWDRVLETLIGAVVGMLMNLLWAPPLWLDTAHASVEDLARQARSLLLRLADQLDRPTAVPDAAARLHEARALDQAVADVDDALRRAEDSLRLNPRASEPLVSRVVLRTGLDTLEICVVVVRVLARSLTDLAKRRSDNETLLAEVEAKALQELLSLVGDALVHFAVMFSSHVTGDAEQAEERLDETLTLASGARDRAADLLLDRVRELPLAWQLHGSMLAEVDRILSELDPEHRSQRLMENLDQAVGRRERARARTPLQRLRRVFGVGGDLEAAHREDERRRRRHGARVGAPPPPPGPGAGER